MREIAGPGAVGGQFVDYDAATNPNGTVYTADYGNDVQNELIAIQSNAGITESAGTNAYVLAAITKQIQDYSKPIGELYYLDSIKTALDFDKDDLSAYFNGICLDAIDVSETISATNWPDLVPHLRAKALTYNEGITGSKSSFDVTDWDITANVATLTFANTTAELAILAALVEDNLVHGSYADWRSITLSGAIGDITAGEYAITAVDATLRTITFAFVASNNSGSGAFTANFYTNRIPGSTTTARVYEQTGKSLSSANYEGDYINGLRKRDAMQRITGSSENADGFGYIRDDVTNISGVYSIGTTSASGGASGSGAVTGASQDFDSAGSVSPNPAKTNDTHTRVNSDIAHLYIHGRSYLVP